MLSRAAALEALPAGADALNTPTEMLSTRPVFEGLAEAVADAEAEAEVADAEERAEAELDADFCAEYSGEAVRGA